MKANRLLPFIAGLTAGCGRCLRRGTDHQPQALGAPLGASPSSAVPFGACSRRTPRARARARALRLGEGVIDRDDLREMRDRANVELEPGGLPLFLLVPLFEHREHLPALRHHLPTADIVGLVRVFQNRLRHRHVRHRLRPCFDRRGRGDGRAQGRGRRTPVCTERSGGTGGSADPASRARSPCTRPDPNHVVSRSRPARAV